jgi:hypothetical protein
MPRGAARNGESNMRHDHSSVRVWLRRIALVGVAAIGQFVILGCGGGGGGDPPHDPPQCSFFSNVCNPDVSFPSGPALVTISPFKLVVQVGASASFTAQSSGVEQPRFRWRRSADGGATYVDVAGATANVLTLPGARLADDGAVFRVDLRGGTSDTVLTSSNAVTLLVSSQPAVVFEDGDFQPGDWSAIAIADPALNGPTHTEDRSASAGLPDAFRHMVHTLTAGPSSLRVFNTKASAVYTPQVLGAIHAIDYREDCERLSATFSSMQVLSYPTVEQAGRRYVSSRGRGCLPLWVGNFDPIPSLQAADFLQVDGPACGSGESCPDFSAGGGPLRLGFERRTSLQAGAPTGSIEHGIDNWKFSIWRP